jgi:ribosomal protein S27AE
VAGAAYVVFCLFCGLGTGLVGRIKGSSFVLWFLLGALFPLLGLVIALLYRVESNELRRQCPTCGRVTKLYDAICTRCGHELDFPDVAIEPESVAAQR